MLFEDELFKNIDFTKTELRKGDYEYCNFSNCDLNGINLSGYKFLECTFNHCNLSMAKLGGTVLNEIIFNNCKLLGLSFEHCSDFSFKVTLKNCIADHCSFYNKSAKQFLFADTQFKNADFTDCDLTGTAFKNCDLTDTKFENTKLEACDFSSSYNFIINPEHNNLKNASFALSSLPGLLTQYKINVVR